MDPRCSPQRIGKAHCADQLSNLRRNRRTTRPAPRFPAPVRPETRPVPTQDRLRTNHGQRVTRVWKQPTDPSQQQPVDGRHIRSARPATAQHDDLLTQHQNLSFQCRSRPEKIGDECPNQPDEIRHRRSVARFSAQCQPDSIYDRHRCHYRKSDPSILVMESAEDRLRPDVSKRLSFAKLGTYEISRLRLASSGLPGSVRPRPRCSSFAWRQWSGGHRFRPYRGPRKTQ